MSAPTYLTPRTKSHSGVLHGRFRRVGRLTEDEAGNRAVAQAVTRAKQGDREALRYLYVHYADHVYGYVASIVRDDYEAEDVTQHVFAKLMTVLPKYERYCLATRTASASSGTSTSTTPLATCTSTGPIAVGS